jgi:hypothetical protein
MLSIRLGLRALALTAVASAAALPSLAGAQPASGPPPACAAGSLPTLEQPCALPACPAGVQPTREAPCAKPFGTGPIPGSQQAGQPGTFCPPVCPGPPAPGGPGSSNPGRGDGGGGKAGDGDRGGDGGGKAGDGGGKAGDHGSPSLMSGFVRRVWRFNADADSYDASTNTLNVTMSKILNLPKRFHAQDDDIVDQDADIVFTKKTKVYDDEGKRLRTESSYNVALDAARSVSVTGKITPQAKWNKDEDGSPVTTVRAKRVTITG